MSPLLTALIILLVVMAILPVLSAVVLWKHRRSEVQALRERSELSQILAALGLVSAGLSLNRLLGWGLTGEVVAIPFAFLLVLVDLASGRWLWQFWLKSKVRRWRRRKA